MLKLNRLLVIMSVERSTSDDRTNSVCTESFKQWLLCNDFAFDEATGYYKGTKEASFIIQCNDFTDVGKLQEEATLADQECIMIVDARNIAFLYYPATKHLENLGYTFQFNRAEQHNRELPDACTIVGDEVYYAV